MVWLGLVRFGDSRYSLTLYDTILSWFGSFIGLFEHGLAWFGMVRLGLARFGESRYSLTLKETILS